jgi:ABC-type antimicrobial peptide transport system permease subunit
VGAAIGGVLSVLTSGVLRDQLYGVSPGDPTTLIGIATLLVVVSLLAAGVPTWRAMRVSAIKALAE